jgi:hypothetical protein
MLGRVHDGAKMWGKSDKLPGSVASGPGAIRVPALARLAAPGENPVCCGRPMDSRLARAHDRLGRALFVAVWQCTACGRVVS